MTGSVFFALVPSVLLSFVAAVHIFEEFLKFCLLIGVQKMADLLAGLVTYHFVLRPELLRQYLVAIAASAHDGLEFFFLLGIQVKVIPQNAGDPLRTRRDTGSGRPGGDVILVEVKRCRPGDPAHDKSKNKEQSRTNLGFHGTHSKACAAYFFSGPAGRRSCSEMASRTLSSVISFWSAMNIL